MNEAVEYGDVLVAVTVEGPKGNIQLVVGKEFNNQTIIALEACYTMYDRKSDTKSIKVTLEDDSYIWVDLTADCIIQRRYRRIAIDGPTETK